MITEDHVLKIEVHNGKENWRMSFNLNEVFFGREEKEIDKSFPIVRYTRWGRIKKIIKLLKKYAWCNEQAVKDLNEWLIYQITVYKDLRDHHIRGGDAYKKYSKQVELLEKSYKEAVKDGK